MGTSTSTPAVRKPRRATGGTTGQRQDRALKIGVLAPARRPVLPSHGGGIESVVSLLVEGLVRDGHDVTLFAAADSITRARLVAARPRTSTGDLGDTDHELLQALSCVRQSASFDVVTSHVGPLGIALSNLMAAPTIHTVYSPVSGESARLLDVALGMAPAVQLVALSDTQRLERPGYAWRANIAAAVDLGVHRCRLEPGGDHLLWIGQMCHEHGPGRAIDSAEAAGLPLILTGPMCSVAERDYFRRWVAPRLDGRIRYLGDVSARRRADLWRGAIALIEPLDWPEAFGLAMIEAGANGVPVIATRRGCAPEVVIDHVNGVIVEDPDDIAAAIPSVRDIAPSSCRRSIEERFSPETMIDGYTRALRSCLSTSPREEDSLATLSVRDGRGLMLRRGADRGARL